MPWVWKDEPVRQVPPAPPAINPASDLSSLRTMAWVVLLSGVILIVGFALLIHYSRISVLVENPYSYESVYNIVSGITSGGYIAGAVLFSLASVASFVTGIVMLASRRARFYNQGLVIATGVVAILGGLIVVSTILAGILLLNINSHSNSLKGYVPPPPGAPQQDLPPSPPAV